MANWLENFFEDIEKYMPLIKSFITLIATFIIFTLILRFLRKYLLRFVKTKKQISNVTVFLDLLKYLFTTLLIIIVISSYYGRWGEPVLIVGLITVSLGWALQKPISGVIAWLVIVIRRPFDIGDRIKILDIKGDVTNITLTHIFLDEIGGTIQEEEKSGRIVMIPNSILFEEEIINYTYQHEYILDEVVVSITYESNLEKAEEIMKGAVLKIMDSYFKKASKISKEPKIRLLFKDSGIDVIVIFNTIAVKRSEIATDIRREIFNEIRKAKDIEFAYPHTEVLFRNKE